MQTLQPIKLPTRLMTLILVTIGVVAASWGLTRFRAPALPAASDDDYLTNISARAGESTDNLIASLQSRLRSNPDDWQAYSQLGLAYLQKGRETGDPTYYQKAEGVLNQALEIEPGDYTSASAMGALALARHQFLAGLEWGERARQINPDRAYAYGVIADAQIELGRYDKAVETLQTMVDLRPDMSSYARISYLRELHGENEGALEMMLQAVDSGDPTAENTAWTRTQLANLYFNMGDLENAEVEYQRTLANRPNYVYALAGLGRVRAAQGRTEEAIDLLTRATQIMPLPEFVITLGDLYQVSGSTEAAQQQYALVRAIEKLYQANGVDLDMEIALFNADHDLDLEATLALARKGYANRPSIYGADVLAWALYKTGNYQEATLYSEQALQLGARDALKFFHAGMIAYKLGETDLAQNYLEQALTINPHFSILYADEARRTLDEVGQVSSLPAAGLKPALRVSLPETRLR